MNPLNPWVHSSLRFLTKKSYEEFCLERPRLRAVQESRLAAILASIADLPWGQTHQVKSSWSYAEFAQHVPVSAWRDWEPWVERQRSGEEVLCHDVERFQPTSGSTQKRKWIPYSKAFLSEIDSASGVWMHDIYQTFPGTAVGTHYWSLSWLPDDLRSSMSNDDLAYFPILKRWFLSQIMAVPERVQHAATAGEAQQQTLLHLLNSRELSLFFVWSPTFLLNLVDEIWLQRFELALWVEKRTRRILEESRNPKEMVASLWPMLALVSAWDTADAKPWAQKLKELFPHAAFQGKGLFATEAVVTIPVQGKQHLAYQSHFYEFKRASGEVIPSWELKSGERVGVIVTTGSGIIRYELGDEVLVEEIYQGCPILRFVGRVQTVDMVGEKLSHEAGRELLQKLGPKALFLLAHARCTKPFYEVVYEGEASKDLASVAEKNLQEHHHYRLARELGQLAPVNVRQCDNAHRFMQDLSIEQGWIVGDVKWEAIIKLTRESHGNVS
jgi:hypothetical protein